MYFGCWLDFNQTEPQFPAGVSGDGPFSSRLPIMQLVRGIHQCLVAEIRFQPGATDPISNGATPGSSDRLAQRNLAIVESDNPGDPSTHVVQHTLLLKPSSQAKRSSAPVGASKFDYDELVIRWNEVPKETIASLYLPACKADDIISLTAAIRNSDTYFKKQDEYTISFVVKDTSYIPLPPSDKPYAGLLSLQLPQSVRTGQQFFVDAQQHSGGVSTRTMQTNSEFRRENFKQNQFSYSHRKVLGAFRLRILVKNGEDLLGRAVRNLAVLKYIALGIPVNDIWYPVFQRYIEQLADKLKGLGIDPGLILPSPDDPGIPGHESTSENEVCYTGKVNKVLYNCFGEFQGFILESCCSDNHHIRCCESGIGQLVLLACKEHLWITVCLSKKEKNKVCGVMIQNRLCNE